MNTINVNLAGHPMKFGFLITEMMLLGIPFVFKHIDGKAEMHATPTNEQAAVFNALIDSINQIDDAELATPSPHGKA